MSFKKIDLSELNESQKKAVTCPLKPVLVVAGAGTGKTKVIIKRYEYLIKECKIDPSQILIVTFTQKATKEIRTRVNELFKDEPLKNYYISTFHKFCINLIKEETGPFTICYVKKGVGCIREAILKKGSKLKAFKTLFNIISRLRWIENIEGRPFDEKDLIKVAKKVDSRITLEKLKEKYQLEEIREIYKEYLSILDENQSLYFDDILFNADFLLDDEVIRKKWDSNTKAILFDEFQDIDPIQFRIIAKLSKNNRNVFCVGDPDQSIYAFRHALPKSFEEFKKTFHDCDVFKLEKNYRSTPEILSVANALINKNPNDFSKNLTTDNPSGDKVRYFLTDKIEIQTEEVLRTIQNLHENFGIPYKSFAVLFRNWNHSKEINNIFLDRNIPFLSKELTKLLERKEIKDLFACLNLAFENDLKKLNKALLRVINKPPRHLPKGRVNEINKKALEKGITLFEYVFKAKKYYDQRCFVLSFLLKSIRDIASDKDKKGLTIKQRVKEILKIFGLWDNWETKSEIFETLKSFLKAVFDDSITDYHSAKERVKLITQFSLDRDKIFLTTIHGAKGLEFDYVFIISLNEGFLPSKYSIIDFESDPSCSSMDDERRLFYVALTRAKKGLYLISSTGKDGASRFIEEIEDHLVKSTNLMGEILKSWDAFEDDEEESRFSDEENFQNSILDENQDDDSDDEW